MYPLILCVGQKTLCLLCLKEGKFDKTQLSLSPPLEPRSVQYSSVLLLWWTGMSGGVENLIYFVSALFVEGSVHSRESTREGTLDLVKCV